MTTRLNAWLTQDEVRRVLNAVPTDAVGRRDSVVLRLGFTAGLRRQEIVNINWSDIDGDRLRLVGKGDKSAIVLLTQGTLDAILRWEHVSLGHADVALLRSFRYSGARLVMNQRRMSANAVRDITQRYSAQTGIKFAPHDMRRTYAGLLLEKTGSIELVSAALRHSNLRTTQLYLERRQDAAYLAQRKAGLDF